MFQFSFIAVEEVPWCPSLSDGGGRVCAGADLASISAVDHLSLTSGMQLKHTHLFAVDELIRDESEEDYMPPGVEALELFQSTPELVSAPPLVSAVMSVGFQVYDAYHQSDFTVIDRDFRCLNDTPMSYNGVPVLEWFFPSCGAEELEKRNVTNLQFNTTPAVIYGDGRSSMAIQGIRPKIDGVEAYQVTAHLANHQVIAVLIRPGHAQVVLGRKPALYEYDSCEDQYYVLYGERAEGIKSVVNPWLPPSKANLQLCRSVDGIMVLANASHVRVKTAPVFNVSVIDSAHVRDAMNNIYKIVLPEDVSRGIVEVAVERPGVVRFIRCRPDRSSPDNQAHINHVMSAARLSVIEKLFPLHVEPIVHDSLMMLNAGMSPDENRMLHMAHPSLMPYSWSAPPEKVSTRSHFVRRMIHVVGHVTYDRVEVALRQSRQYSRSGLLLTTKTIVPMTAIRKGLTWLSSQYFVGCKRVLVIQVKDFHPLLKPFIKTHGTLVFYMGYQRPIRLLKRLLHNDEI